MSNDSQQLGLAIRQRRIDLALTQGDGAEALRISLTTLSQAESGSLGQAKTFIDIASSLGLDVILVPRHSKDGHAGKNSMLIAEESPRRRVRRS